MIFIFILFVATLHYFELYVYRLPSQVGNQIVNKITIK